MRRIRLYHGSQNRVVHPLCTLKDEQRDFGRGLYLSEDRELAREWSVALPGTPVGYVHEFELDLTDLNILDLTRLNPLV